MGKPTKDQYAGISESLSSRITTLMTDEEYAPIQDEALQALASLIKDTSILKDLIEELGLQDALERYNEQKRTG